MKPTQQFTKENLRLSLRCSALLYGKFTARGWPNPGVFCLSKRITRQNFSSLEGAVSKGFGNKQTTSLTDILLL